MNVDNSMAVAVIITTLTAYLTPQARRDAAETLDDYAQRLDPITAQFMRTTAQAVRDTPDTMSGDELRTDLSL